LGFRPEDNPVAWIEAPKRPFLILPSLSREQVDSLIDRCQNSRDKAIIAIFTESGLRVSELAGVKPSDIDWENHTIRTIGKGNKEGYAPFGAISERYLKDWLSEYQPNGSIWGMNKWGISSMLSRLGDETGLPCNPHTFRRTFACLLRKAGVDSMTIKDLGRWESVEMVQRYTRSVTFEDCMKQYKAPLSGAL
jgi:site-specific recombinase XerD